MFFKRILLIISLLISCTLECKPPDLSPKDAKKKVEEILKAHVSFKALDHEILKRSLISYLEELDPSKSYFIESEIIKWTDPTPETLDDIEKDFRNESFAQFQIIYDLMLQNIVRRNELEKKISQLTLPKSVKSTDFKDLNWAKDEEELKCRVMNIKSLQLEIAEKLDSESKEQLAQKISKRRYNHEQELLGSSKKDRECSTLAFVLKAITSSLDAHTSYFTPSEANQFMIQVQQRLFGIGAQLRDDLNGFSIVRLLEGSPALLSNKLKVGDRIVAVNYEPVVGLDIIEAVDLIRGPQGSKVLLTILRENSENKEQEKFDIEIVRDEIVLKESRFESKLEPYGEGVIAHLKLHSFYQDPNTSSTKDIKDALDKIKKDNLLLGVVLDLRNNAGGILPQAVSVSGLFISKGVVVSIKNNNGKIQHLRNFENQVSWDGPLLILTNRASASAAEIVAQSLQDYGRALIIGDDHTYGKGSYQSFTLESSNSIKVNPQGEYKVTRGIYYTVSGKTPQLHGAKADIVVPGIFSELEIGESFAKYPLQTDQISPNFDDDLSDIHPLHRGKMKRLYKNNLQERLQTYEPHLQSLKQNAEKRMSINQNYQAFLTEIKKKEFSLETMESFGQNDLQLEESFNIMKDLILLMKKNSPQQTVLTSAA